MASLIHPEDDFAVLYDGRHPIADDPDAAIHIDSIWRAMALKCHLFDSSIFSVSSVTPKSASVSSINYRHYIGALNDRSLAERYPIRPLAVTGLCETTDGHILIGQRKSNVSAYAGCWEAVPAGTVEQMSDFSDKTVCSKYQVLRELEEELFLNRDICGSPQLFAVLEGVIPGPVNLCYRIPVRMTKDELLNYLSSNTLPEHDSVDTVSSGTFEDLMSSIDDCMVPGFTMLLAKVFAASINT